MIFCFFKNEDFGIIKQLLKECTNSILWVLIVLQNYQYAELNTRTYKGLI